MNYSPSWALAAILRHKPEIGTAIDERNRRRADPFYSQKIGSSAFPRRRLKGIPHVSLARLGRSGRLPRRLHQ
jgi:hypothetical protein